MRTHSRLIQLMAIAAIAGPVPAAEPVNITMHRVDSEAVRHAIGTIRATSTPYGVVFEPDLSGLPAGIHGFHMHQNPNCDPGEKGGKKVAALKAGGHFDPDHTGTHQGPYAHGHLGDLPALTVAADGVASLPVLAPRLRLLDLANRSLVVHQGADNYSDQPSLGGGGARIACGVVPRQ